MMKYFLFLFLGISLLSCNNANSKKANSDEWLTNLQEGFKKANAENKYIFVVFSGSDWCVPCQRLDAEVLESDSFKKLADQKFVKVKFDFPRKKENQLSEVQTQYNESNAQQFAIEGFPTVIIFDKSGKELNRWVGYDPSLVSTLVSEYQKFL